MQVMINCNLCCYRMPWPAMCASVPMCISLSRPPCPSARSSVGRVVTRDVTACYWWLVLTLRRALSNVITGKEAVRLAEEALNKPEHLKTDKDRSRQKIRDGSGGILDHDLSCHVSLNVSVISACTNCPAPALAAASGFRVTFSHSGLQVGDLCTVILLSLL